jgi:hypothetical protein
MTQQTPRPGRDTASRVLAAATVAVLTGAVTACGTASSSGGTAEGPTSSAQTTASPTRTTAAPTTSGTPTRTSTRPASGSGSDCFSGDSLTMVLDFSADAETFTGALRITTDGVDEYQAVAGRRRPAGGTVFRVAVQRLGIGGDRTEVWTAGKSGMDLGDGTTLPDADCTKIAAQIRDLRVNVKEFPAVPR